MTAAFPFFFKIGFPSSVVYFFKPTIGLTSNFWVVVTFWRGSDPQLLLFSSSPILFLSESSSFSNLSLVFSNSTLFFLGFKVS